MSRHAMHDMPLFHPKLPSRLLKLAPSGATTLCRTFAQSGYIFAATLVFINSCARHEIRDKIMAKVFRITPKATHRNNGTILTPAMEIIVTLEHSTSDPSYNGAKEVKAMYMDKYGFDYERACATKAWFDIERLD